MLPSTIAILLFSATYLGLLVFSDYRAFIALGSAILFVALGILSPGEALSSVDWNVIMMIAGTMGTVSLFIESRMPARLADLIINRVPDVKWAIISLSIFASLISAFIDNVATVLMLAPLALGIARKLNISPVSGVIAIAIASNLEGAATLVGDTTSILLGGYARMSFLDFFFLDGRMGMFWIVQIAAVAAILVLWISLRGEKQPLHFTEPETVDDYVPAWLLLGTVGLLIAAIGCALYLAAGGDRKPVQLPFGWSTLVAALLVAVLGVVMYLALAPLYELQGGMYTILLLARILEYMLLLMVVQRMAGARGIGAITTAYLSLGLVAAAAHNMLLGPM